MADNNKITIEIVTTDKGATASIKNQKKLKKSIDSTGNSLKKAEKEGKGFHRQQKGIAQSNLSSAKGFSKMQQSIGGGSSGLVGAYATLAANVFAATAAFNALRGAAQVTTLIEGFNFLGNAAGQTSSQIANGLKDITNNAISMEEALRASAIALTSGFNIDQISELASVARNASIALGRNMGDSIDRLFRGVAKLEPEILDELGIMVRLDTAVAKYAAQLGKSKEELTDFERRQAFLNETLQQGALKYGDLSNAVDPNAYDKLAGALMDLSNAGLELINKFINPFIKLLAGNSGALAGGIILFASTILTTMIPALGQMAERQTKVALTAKHMAAEQAKAGKQAAQTAKIGFVKGGSAATTTKGTDFTAVKALKKALKSNTVSQKDFDKATQQVQNTMKRTAAIAMKNGTASSSAHIKRMAELKALEAQILGVQNTEAGRSGAAGASALADGQAAGQEGGANQMALIGGAGAGGGFKLAKEGFKDFRDTQTKAFEGWKKQFGKPGIFKKFGMMVARGFGAAGMGVKLFGAALMNAIPLVGQILFFGGLLVAFLMSFKGEASASSKAQDRLNETIDTAKEKFEQLAETNAKLNDTLDKLEKNLRKVAVAARAQMNEIVVTAGVVQEARLNFSSFTDALADEKISKAGLVFRGVGESIKSAGVALKDVFLAAIIATFPFLNSLIKMVQALGLMKGLKVMVADVGKGLDDTFGKNQEDRQAKFSLAQKEATKQVEKLRAVYPSLAATLENFDPSESFRVLSTVTDDVTGKLLTFEQAAEIVDTQFRMMTEEVEMTSETLKGLGTSFQEVGKVFNKEINSILKRNAFDKIKGTVQSLNNSLIELSKGSLLTNAELMNQITLASDATGISMSQFGVTVESVRANLEAGKAPYQELEKNMGKIATMTRQTSGLSKEYAANLKEVASEAAKTEKLDAYALKLENLAKVGKFEIGVVSNFELQTTVAKNARDLAQKTLDIKNAQVDQEFALERFKLQVFKEMTGDATLSAEMTATMNTLDDIIEARKKLNQDEFDSKIIQIDSKEAVEKGKAGTVGTLGERSTTAGAALNKEGGAAAKLDAMRGAVSPMIDALKELGPEGDAIAGAFAGIMSIADAFAMAGKAGLTTADKIEAVGSVVSAISGMMAANSKAQIAEIDTQIDAEKKRDGKSKESLGKISALEKKKESMARKAFEQGKKMKIASAIISTSAAIAGQLSMDPVGPWNIALAAGMGALGLAQVAIIRKQKYSGGDASGGAPPSTSLSIGSRSNAIDVSRPTSGSELSSLREATSKKAAAGMKSYASGGDVLVGERGPEIISPLAPIEITPNSRIGNSSSNINFTINAVDASGVEDLLINQRGNIIRMIREAANENGEDFLAQVDPMAYGSNS